MPLILVNPRWIANYVTDHGGGAPRSIRMHRYRPRAALDSALNGSTEPVGGQRGFIDHFEHPAGSQSFRPQPLFCFPR